MSEIGDDDQNAATSTHTWTRHVTRTFEELGLMSVYSAPLDTKLLVLQRYIRLYAYGGSTLILVAYLAELGNSDRRIGTFMTLTLAGDVCISFILTLYADRWGRKVILMLGALLMVASGVVFALSDNFFVLLLAAILGVISPSGNEIGPFRAIEESTLAQLTHTAVRSDIYAWYSLIGNAGSASGMITCGWVIHRLRSTGWGIIPAYRAVFYAYAVAGFFKFILACSLSSKVELERKSSVEPDAESAPLLARPDGPERPRKPSSWKKLLPTISKESKTIVVQLCALFALDAFASGLASLSWVTYFFKWKFNLDEGKLGTLFSVASIISAASVLVASSISKRLGNVKTMVFTHLPSAVALSLIPIPSTPIPAMGFLILRACTQSMDVAPRSAFLAAIILPSERTVVMGIINMVKTFSQSLGPLVTGALASQKLFWIAFVMAGSLKATYDLGFLIVFAERKAKKTNREEEGEH